jgi:hypothetical protein
MNNVVIFVIGLMLRIGIPVAVTILVIALLRRLDKRWQKESLALPMVPVGEHCWEVKGCSKEQMENCPAVAQPDVPCWQTFRSKDGALNEVCLDCEVFRQASVPRIV